MGLVVGGRPQFLPTWASPRDGGFRRVSDARENNTEVAFIKKKYIYIYIIYIYTHIHI